MEKEARIRASTGDNIVIYNDLRKLPRITDPTLAPKVPCVYFFLDPDGLVLYVGQTGDLFKRLQRHVVLDRLSKTQSNLEVRWCPESDLSRRLQIEGIYILSHLPPENKALLLKIARYAVYQIRWRKPRKSGTRSVRTKRGR